MKLSGNRRAHLFWVTNMQTEPMSIKQTVSRAFKLAQDAAMLRDALARHLATAAPGRTHATLHRCYVTLTDLTVAFDHLEAALAEGHAVGRYLLKGLPPASAR
jgi:hypothetical protein